MARFNIRTKIMLVFMLLFTVALAALLIWFYLFASGVAMNNLRDDLVTSAEITAGMIDPAEFARAEAGDEAAFEGIAGQLDLVFTSNPNAAQVYVMVPTAPGSDQYRVVAVVYYDAEADEVFESGDEPYDAGDLPEVQAALLEPTASSDVREDDYGVWLSGYAPIKDEAGQTIGVAGVDMNEDDVKYVRGQILIGSVIAFALAYLAVFLVAYYVSGAITGPMRAITGAARTLEQGEPFEPETLAPVAKGADEVGQLARVFSKMAVEVQSREKKLKQEIQKLQIEIDETKRAREVKEIVDTEYFRDLKKKARDLRETKDDPKK
jgi:HAMP domain-containing protein